MAKNPDHWTHGGASLFTHAGERKYLNADERQRFYQNIIALDDPEAQTFCEMLFWTGCRPSEALALTASQIDFAEQLVILRSLKKRGASDQFRPVPLPEQFLKRLADVHGLEVKSRSDLRLWPMGRTSAWKHVAAVMSAAGITGARASARGLRHSLGVSAILQEVPVTRIQRWLGHSSLDVTAIYLDVASPEDRTLARRMWGEAPQAEQGVLT